MNEIKKDLVVLVADQDAEFAVRALLTRLLALRIRDIEFKIVTHPYHDGSCRKDAAEYMRPYLDSYEHLLVLFDRHGSGRDQDAREDIERDVENDLKKKVG
ncbi:MAG: hypothetical protein M1457_09885 [bacterium]|nr:hypothetical protein [bacterium]